MIRPISLETLPLNYSPILRKSESLVQQLFPNLLYQLENIISNEENICPEKGVNYFLKRKK